ncbi:MAG TPA: nitroreductase family protein [Blastocatellia bacterium]|nr:nitroreductase family protein [Blastocatellia bacterium]
MQETTENPSASGTAADALTALRKILATAPGLLAALPGERVGFKPAPDVWSPKEELGHLIDSAANNHQRVVRAQLEDHPAMPGYDGDEWVRLQAYQQRDWRDLIELWRAGNHQLLAAAEAAGAADWSRTLTVGGSEPMTFQFLVEDYVRHMCDHLRHIGLDVDGVLASDSTYPEKAAHTNYPINELMRRRWSPRAFEEGRAVEREKILTLLEAARWAPSCFNEQPWRYLVFDGSDAEAMKRAQECLVEGNAWALKAPLLMISVARENFTYNEEPNRTAHHDVGLASENLVLEAVELGLAAHQMVGFDRERARREFAIPEGYSPIAMIAVGYPYRGDLQQLPEKLRAKETAGRSRRPIGEIAFAGRWDNPYGE